MSALAKVIKINSYSDKINELLAIANRVIVDKENVIKLSVSCLLANGHLLIEDRPGVGKTTLVKVLSKLLGLNSQRIQFTNDLLPADIIGTSIFNKDKQKFEFHKGPLFSNFILADEINRATPKTQSACLQAMEEYSVSVDGVKYDLPTPFFLVATQNPQDSVGTFPLPESQLDRFLMKLQIGLPSRKAEREIIMGRDRAEWINELPQVFNEEHIIGLMEEIQDVFLSEGVLDYLQDLVDKSRTLSQGLSPRAVIDFSRAAKAWAYLEGRNFVIPEDIQAVGVSVINHRLVNSNSSSVSGFDLATEIIRSVPVP
jgi:MoxR-like ATPase